MRHGRPPVGPAHVDRLDGTEELKERLRVVLETITGEVGIEEACERLGVGPSRVHEMRRQALQAALEGLAPGRAGRPPRDTEADADRVHELEEKVRDLKIDLHAALVRTEIALAMPHVLRRESKKKDSAKRLKKRR